MNAPSPSAGTIATLFLGATLFVHGAEKNSREPVGPKIVSSPAPSVTTSAREKYRLAITELETSQRDIRRRYLAAIAEKSRMTQDNLIKEARSKVFTTLVEKIFPAWYGTGWDFNGVSQEPGKGTIACGYFVTTTLRDAGFDLPRVKLAQQPSQTIIHSLTGRESISISAGRPIADIEKHIRESGSGLYLVGLDTHVGYVVNDGESLAFIHSSYYRPPGAVVAEATDSVNPLRDSNYRVVGKILDDTMMRKWILGGTVTLNERK